MEKVPAAWTVIFALHDMLCSVPCECDCEHYGRLQVRRLRSLSEAFFEIGFVNVYLLCLQ